MSSHNLLIKHLNFTCIFVFIFIPISVHKYMHTFIHMCTFLHRFIPIHICIYIRICMYTTQTYICTFVHSLTHGYVHLWICNTNMSKTENHVLQTLPTRKTSVPHFFKMRRLIIAMCTPFQAFCFNK